MKQTKKMLSFSCSKQRRYKTRLYQLPQIEPTISVLCIRGFHLNRVMHLENGQMITTWTFGLQEHRRSTGQGKKDFFEYIVKLQIVRTLHAQVILQKTRQAALLVTDPFIKLAKSIPLQTSHLILPYLNNFPPKKSSSFVVCTNVVHFLSKFQVLTLDNLGMELFQ